MKATPAAIATTPLTLVFTVQADVRDHSGSKRGGGSMSMRCVGGALAAAFLATANTLAQVNPPPTYPSTMPTYPSTVPTYPGSVPTYMPGSPNGPLGAKNPLLLALVIQPLLQQSGASLSSGIGMLFARFFNALFGHNGNAPNAAAQYPGSVVGTPGSPAGYVPGIAPYGTVYPGTATYGTPGVPQYGTGYPQSIPSTSLPGYPSVPTTPASSTGYPSGYTGPQATVPPYGPGGVAQSSPGATTGAAAPPPPSQGYAGYTASPSSTSGPNPYGPGVPPAATAAGPAAMSTGPPSGPTIAKSGLLPSVIYTLNRLDPTTYKTTGQLDLTHGAPTLHTGDVFAIEYSTNVSGQVRIDNIDSAGQMSGLGTYTVLSGHDNRIPVTKGIKLVGTTGTETFKLYFYPCLATDSSGHPDPAAVSANLPPCPNAPSPKLLQASKGFVAAKSAINLDSPDPTIAVSAVAEYQTSDVAEHHFQLQHLPQE